MYKLLVVLCCVLSINAQDLDNPEPEPYSFAFSSPNDDGSSSSRQETGDANGRVTGFYTILGADGQQRRVEYVADENGFRANIITNEIGTESQNPADTLIKSSAPTAAELTAQWEASGAGRAQLALNKQLTTGQAFSAGGSGQFLASRAVLKAPATEFRSGLGLVQSPVVPIGGGIAGVQSLRFNQGVRLAAPVAATLKPFARSASIPVSVSPLPAPVALKPVAQSLPVSFQSNNQFGLRTQAIAPFNTGLIGSEGLSSFGVNKLQGFEQLDQSGLGVSPLGFSGANFQQFDKFTNVQTSGPLGVRKLALGGFPIHSGANLLILQGTGSGSGLQKQSQLLLDESINKIAQKKESDSDEYGRKSK